MSANGNVATRYCSGVIVFSKNLTHVLIVESKWKGNYGFPKGRKENQDKMDWRNTAIRELEEETSISAKYDSDILFLRCYPGNQLAFVGESIHKPKFTCHCRYAIAVHRNINAMNEVKLKPKCPKEVLSIKWCRISADGSSIEKKESLRASKIDLLHQALRLTEIFEFS